MKSTFKVLGTQSRLLCAIALVAIIGFSMAACDDGGGSGSSGGNSGGGGSGGDSNPRIQGKYVYYEMEFFGMEVSLTFTGSNYSLAAQGGTTSKGTFTISANTMTLTCTQVISPFFTEDQVGYVYNLTIVDNNTLRDNEGHILRKQQ